MSRNTDKPRPEVQRAYLLAIVAATILAAALRLFNLGGFGFFGDEYSTVESAVKMKVTEPNWPLLFWVSQVVGKTAGVSEWTIRLTPAVLGIACIPLFYWAGRRAFGELPMLLAGLLIATNHWHLFHSQSGRFYTAVFLFSGLAICWLARAVQTGQPMFAVAAAVSVAISAGFHPTGIWPAVAFGMFCLLALAVPSIRGELSWKVALAFFVPLALAGVSIFFRAFLRTSTFVAGTEGWGYTPAHFLMGWARGMELPLLAVAGCWLLWMLRHERAKGWFCMIVGVVPLIGIVVVAVIGKPVRPDYVFASVPVWFILAGAGAAQVVAAASVPLAARAGLILALFAAQFPSTVSHHLENLTCDPRSVYNYVKTHGRDDDLYYHNFVPMMKYYTGRSAPKLSSDKKQLDPLLANVLFGGKTTWFLIRASRGGISNDVLAEWLARHATVAARFDAKRIDHEVSTLYVYRFDPPNTNVRPEGRKLNHERE